MRDPFDSKKFDDAKNNGGGKWAAAGFYPEILIRGVKNIECGQDNCGATVIEYDIVTSNVPECPPEPGYSHVMKDKHVSYFSNVRRVIAELTGADFEQVTREICRSATSEVQPLEGTKASLRVSNVRTRAGGTFSKHVFRMTDASPKMKKLAADAAASAGAPAQ